MPKTVAIIPLRGCDEEAQPDAVLGGKPVLVHSIEAARAARCIDRVIVSTDSPVVAALARRSGAEAPFLRPAHLAAPNVPLSDVLQHSLAWLDQHETEPVEIIVVLESTHPIRPPGLIDQVVEVLRQERLDTVFAARQEPHRFWRMEDGAVSQIQQEEQDRPRSQARPLYKELAGMATAVRADVIRRGERMGVRVGLVPIHSYATAVDLHDEDGWWLARQLLDREGSSRAL